MSICSLTCSYYKYCLLSLISNLGTHPFCIVEEQPNFIALSTDSGDVSSLNTEHLMDAITQPIEGFYNIRGYVHLLSCVERYIAWDGDRGPRDLCLFPPRLIPFPCG